MQRPIEAASHQHTAGVLDPALNPLGALRNGVGVTGRRVIQNDHLVARRKELRGDDRPDVAGPSSHQQPHGPVPSTRVATRSTRRSGKRFGACTPMLPSTDPLSLIPVDHHGSDDKSAAEESPPGESGRRSYVAWGSSPGRRTRPAGEATLLAT